MKKGFRILLLVYVIQSCGTVEDINYEFLNSGEDKNIIISISSFDKKSKYDDLYPIYGYFMIEKDKLLEFKDSIFNNIKGDLAYSLTKFGGKYLIFPSSTLDSYICCQYGSLNDDIIEKIKQINSDTSVLDGFKDFDFMKIDSAINSKMRHFKVTKNGYQYNIGLGSISASFCLCRNWHPSISLLYSNYNDFIFLVKSLENIKKLSEKEMYEYEKMFNLYYK